MMSHDLFTMRAGYHDVWPLNHPGALAPGAGTLRDSSAVWGTSPVWRESAVWGAADRAGRADFSKDQRLLTKIDQIRYTCGFP